MKKIQGIAFTKGPGVLRIQLPGGIAAYTNHNDIIGLEKTLKENSVEFRSISMVEGFPESPEEKNTPHSKWKSTKLWAAAVVFATASVAMFTGFLSGSWWGGIATCCLGIYSGQKVWQNVKLGGGK